MVVAKDGGPIDPLVFAPLEPTLTGVGWGGGGEGYGFVSLSRSKRYGKVWGTASVGEGMENETSSVGIVYVKEEGDDISFGWNG